MNLSSDAVAVPIASEEDATITCDAVRPYLDDDTELVVIHVVEKAGGGIDPAPLEERKRLANSIFDRCRATLSGTGARVTTELVFHTDVVQGVLDAAADADADVIVFVPRESHRLLKLVSGDTAVKLVERSDRPVVVLPSEEG